MLGCVDRDPQDRDSLPACLGAENSNRLVDRLQKELALERLKNQKPEIVAEILAGFFNWGPFTKTGLLITLLVRLLNTSPARGSVRECSLLVAAEDGTAYNLRAERLVLP